MNHMFGKDLVLPVEKRQQFKEPLGIELYDDELQSFDTQTTLITVGDVVSLTFRKHGIRPDLSIYDGFTERREMTEFAALVKDEPRTEVINPAGTVTVQLAEAVRAGIGGKTDLIHVTGEEDLALLPCILLSENGTRIVYGWPGRCMMLVTTDELTKKKASELLALMEEPE